MFVPGTNEANFQDADAARYMFELGSSGGAWRSNVRPLIINVIVQSLSVILLYLHAGGSLAERLIAWALEGNHLG